MPQTFCNCSRYMLTINIYDFCFECADSTKMILAKLSMYASSTCAKYGFVATQTCCIAHTLDTNGILVNMFATSCSHYICNGIRFLIKRLIILFVEMLQNSIVEQ